MRIAYALVVAAALVFGGCNGKNSNSNLNANANSNLNKNAPNFTPPEPITPVGTVDPNFQACNPYYPLVPGSLLKYTINFSSGLVADATIIAQAADENSRKVFTEITQIIDKSGGLEKTESSTRKFVCNDGRVQMISEKSDNRIPNMHTISENRFRGDAIVMSDLATLARKGATWSYSFNQTFQVEDQPPMSPEETINITFTVQGAEDVTVPAGKFKAIKVTRKVKETEVTDYYVRGIGLVKRASGEGTTMQLVEYSGLRPME